MFDTTDVLVYRQPVSGTLIDHGAVVIGAGIAKEIPGRVHEGVHRVGLAARRRTALRARAVQEAVQLAERVAAAIRHEAFRERDRELVIGHRHHTASTAVNERNGAAPIALARNAPVTQAPIHLLFAVAQRAEVGSDGVDGRIEAEAIVLATVHADAIVPIPRLPGFVRIHLAADVYDLLNGQRILQREREVALIVGRHAHDGAFAVTHEHVVADPHGQRLTGQRMLHGKPSGDALLLHLRDVGFHDAATTAFVDERRNCCVLRRGLGGQRMFRCDGQEGNAHQRIGARGKHAQQTLLTINVVREGEVHTRTATNPVGLHGTHALRPARQAVQCGQQFFGVARDVQVVHRDFALLDERTRAPATTVNDLLIGEHGVVDRVPVHGARALIGNALLEHAQEQPLVPTVVVGAAGGHLAVPIDAEAQRLQLALHIGDVVVRPLRRRHLVLHRRVFRRQAESIPAHGLQHVAALHAHEAADDVANGVIAHVAHMQAPARVREHAQAVILLARGVFDGAESAVLIPPALGGRFNGGRRVDLFNSHGKPAGTVTAPTGPETRMLPQRLAPPWNSLLHCGIGVG